MKLTIVKQLNNTFKAAYDNDYEKMKKLKVGDFLECDIRKPRNYKFHKKYFALLNLLFQNQERYKHLEDLRHDIIIECGYFTIREDINGHEIRKPDSLSFAKMDEHAFTELYSRTVDVIVKYFNFDRQEIIDNVEQYF